MSRGPGRYRVDLRLRRPGLETASRGEHQILFLDFDGAAIDPSTFGTDSGTLSPLADFLAGWGLGPDDEDALIDAILATFTENLVEPTSRSGAATPASTSRSATAVTTPTRGGSPTSAASSSAGPASSSATNTVGLAESIDPGNFAREETGVVLLDQLSAPAGSGLATINDFAGPDTDMVAFVGRTVGFVASHEAAHFLGNWHTRPNNGVVSIMDTFRTSPSSASARTSSFGTADDVDVDFVTDEIIEGRIGAGGHDDPHRLRPVQHPPPRRSRSGCRSHVRPTSGPRTSFLSC